MKNEKKSKKRIITRKSEKDHEKGARPKKGE